MRTLKEILQSVIKSYHNNESINYIDLRDLDGKIDNLLFLDLVSSYNENKTLHFLQIRELSITINK